MSAKHLSERDSKWVEEARKTGTKAEQLTLSCLVEGLIKGRYSKGVVAEEQYIIRKKPKLTIGKWNFEPEAIIENLKNGKRLIYDDKHGEKGGNAHERAYKYFTGAVERSEYIPLVVFSGPTFAAAEPFQYPRWDKKKKKKVMVTVNPQRYRNEFEAVLSPDQYFILTDSNQDDLINKIRERLS